MSQLTYLVDEICAGLEIYYAGRTGGQYLKTAFILCDDYTELTSKLFLITKNSSWSDQKAKGGFKNYIDIQRDVQAVFSTSRPGDLAQVKHLHDAMATRRKRRNDFFHSTKLLDLSLSARNCIEAYCDLLEYGALIFGASWTLEVASNRNLETLEALIRLERKSLSDPSVQYKVNSILSSWPTNTTSRVAKKGCHIIEYPADMYLMLCVVYGGKDLLTKLKALL